MDQVLARATENGRWNVAGKVLKVGGSEEQHARTIKEACDRASDWGVIYILPHCNTGLACFSTQQLDQLLANATHKERWAMAGEVLKVGGSEEQRTRTIEEACERASHQDFEYYILPLCETVVASCSTKQRDQILATATHKGRWDAAGEVLKVGGSEGQCERTLEEACDRASDYDLEKNILPHCNTVHLNWVLATATRKRRWKLAGEVLKVGGKKKQRARTIKEACGRASDQDFECYILPHCKTVVANCSTQQRDQILATAIRTGRWKVAGTVLKVGGSETQQKWAIEEASKRAEETDFNSYILPHCTGDQLESALTHLVGRRLCKSVSLLLERGVSDTQHRWAVEEASKKAEESDFNRCILPHCTSDQLESMLTHLVSRRLWKSVSLVLEKGVRREQARLAFSKACAYSKAMNDIKNRLGQADIQALVNSVSSNTLPLDAQSTALRFALQQNRWDVISQACLSQV
jgi:flavin-binding protein dodecin